MGLFATIKGLDKCPKCGEPAIWQSKGLWLNYKDKDIWIGYENEIKLDKNMHGHIVCYCFDYKKNKYKHILYYKIRKGQLIKSTEKKYQL